MISVNSQFGHSSVFCIFHFFICVSHFKKKFKFKSLITQKVKYFSSLPYGNTVGPSFIHLPVLPPTESPCRGEPVRDYHRLQRGTILCQTSKPFSWVECQGRCQTTAKPDISAASCCAPLRVRRRRLTFECDDGTSFTQDVEKPVECGCKECVQYQWCTHAHIQTHSFNHSRHTPS